MLQGMEHSPSRLLAYKEHQHKNQVGASMGPGINLTAKDGLFIATECHLALLPDEDGDTALHLAVVQNDIEACKKVLKLFHIAGKSIDVRNNLLQTPLHVAVITNQKEIVKLLLNHKSSPHNPDRFGSTAFHLCAKYNHADCLIEILQNTVEKDRHHLNIRDYEGLTALHVAVRHGSVATFKVLVANGADIDAKDNKGGRTPLIYAIEMNERNIVEMLLECDASVSQQTYSGDTALHIASGRGLQDIVRLLLRRGADATMKNTHLETPLSLATSPSVTDIFRTQYNSTHSPEVKPLTTADSQYASYVARNMSVPMPPQFLNRFSHDKDRKSQPIIPQPINMNDMKMKMKPIKREHRGFENDDTIPAKRMAENSLHSSTSPNTTVIIPFHQSYHPVMSPVRSRDQVMVTESPHLSQGMPVKQEYIEILPADSTPNIQFDASKPDDETLKKDMETAEEVEITLEEVEVSSEEVVQSKSDGEEKGVEASYAIVKQDGSKTSESITRAESPEPVYTHKLMQYSTHKNSVDRKLNNNTTVLKNALDSIGDSKPVIVQKQPQIDVATALYRSNFNLNSNYKNFTPSTSPMLITSSQDIKSKSVPNSPQPQPAEANLYQLAREGLAVAAMANSSNQIQSNAREFGITNYLKARPSRQAKIKAGTEELQNLALQGLAVAAMNAKSEELFGKKQHSEENETTTNVATVPKHLTQVLTPVVKKGQMPPLHRSNSLPPKHYYDQEMSSNNNMFTGTNPSGSVQSNHHLLALAHANARKENVGQAVSAISMGRAQGNANHGPKYQPGTSGVPAMIDKVSENTKLNLRQAIMVKNNSPSMPQKGPILPSVIPRRIVTHPIKVPTAMNNKPLTSPVGKFQVPKSPLAGIPLASPARNIVTTTTTTPPSSDLESKSSPVSTISSKVLNITIPRKIEVPPQTQNSSIEENITKSHMVSSTQTVLTNSTIVPVPPQYVKVTNAAPTNTVAPLQMLMNKGVPLSSRKTEQQTLVSTVGIAPIVASRVSNHSSLSASLPQENAKNIAVSGTITAPSVLPHMVPPSLTSTSYLSAIAGSSGVTHLPVELQSQSMINPLTNISLVGPHAGSYLQPQIAYAPYGKDLIPVLIHGGHAAALQAQYALQMQVSQAVKKESAIISTATPTVQINPAYLGNVGSTRLPTLDPNVLGRIPMSLHDAQMRGLYPMATPVLGGHHMDLLQQQQYIRHLYQQQSLLLQSQSKVSMTDINSMSPAVTSVAPAQKPVAAVSAVPVLKPGNHDPKYNTTRAKMTTSPNVEEQPLNLSTKNIDQPLNLKKNYPTVTQSSSSIRSSVIKVASSVQNEQQKMTEDTLTMSTTVHQLYQQRPQSQPTSIMSALGERPVYPSVILPPPIMLPGTVPQSLPSGSASLLPPIHYVNYFGLPPQM
ncbi:uncharacterized protein LOC120348661 [Styela clava]